ncbi:recombinase RecA, partial [Streptomyces microflavus]
LKDNPDLADEIEKKILEKLGVGVRPEAETAEDTATAPAPDTAPVPDSAPPPAGSAV